ncbi:MAG TPA: hypothetical protein VJ826_01090 [Candidatus Polarisedimenticolaceae bacterium]|nr:hypothetical protein [Candidatus Polarisedimenticolaceae bacterium]
MSRSLSVRGLILHELGMSLRRPGLWVAYGLLFVFHMVVLFAPPPIGEWVKGETISRAMVWPAAGRFLAALNVFFPLIAGILTADRLQRDARLGMRELQESTPLSPAAYVLTKYAGVLASVLLPLVVWASAIAVLMAATGHAPWSFVPATLSAFLAITVPAFAFVVAFSIACPLVLPLPVYQVLFIGYWLWANFVPPQLFPTLNGTLVTPSGMFVLALMKGPSQAAALDAALNVGLLAACTLGVLALLTVVLARRARLA